VTELQDLLHRATDRIDGPDLAARALAGARRRRAHRRGIVAVVAAAAAVVAVVVSVELTTGGGARVDPPPAQSPSPTPTQAVATAPAIDPARIQPVWDPRDVEGLPVTDLGVPRVMESLVPGVVTRPVAVLDDGERALLVSGDGRSEELPLPDGLGELRTVSLSPDGTRLAVTGISGFFWRPQGGAWQRVGDAGEGVAITWAPDGTPRLGDGDDLIDATSYGALENLQRQVGSTSSVAAARANATWPEERQRDDYDGLIAIERETLATRGFLRVPDQRGYYVDGGTLTPIAWLDQDTVAFTVLPKGAAKSYLVAWDVETGRLSRISCWERSFSAVFATGLLGS
jgi:hypothetical protein